MNLFKRAVRRLAPLFLVFVLAAAPRDASVRVAFSAPAGKLPAGPILSATYGAVLPSGRIVDPLGKSVAVGNSAFGFAIAPGGRYAVVATGTGGAGVLSVVDTQYMSIASRYAGTAGAFTGVAALRDPTMPTRTLVLASVSASNAIYVFTLAATGELVPDDVVPQIAIPVANEQGYADAGRAEPATIVIAHDGARAFVIDRGASNVTTIDLRTRTISGSPIPVGFAPYAAAIGHGVLLVANEGLMRPGILAAPAGSPQFASPSFEAGMSSSLSVLGLTAETAGASRFTVQMDQAPDGTHIVGGAHPAAIAVTPSGRTAYVAMAGVDRVATVTLEPGAPRVAGGTELRLYDRGPYGTQPDALAVSRDGSRLYVALAGINAVAVLDARNPRRLHRLGLMPTGWQPSQLSLSRDLGRLYVLNARGTLDGSGAATATLQRIDLATTHLSASTRRALACARKVSAVHQHPIVPQVLGNGSSPVIKHVVLLLAGSESFDAMLGDLAATDSRFSTVADPSLVRYGAAVTPNLHALAQTFGVAANLYNDARSPAAGQALALGGMETMFDMRAHAAAALGSDEGISPDDYPRMGYLYDSLAAHHLTYRDYGALLDVRGASNGRYTLDVPALAALGGNVDAQFPGGDATSNVTRADEFARDYALVTPPDFVSIRLTNALAGPLPETVVADQDRALGRIVGFLTHRSEWPSTAIFVLPEAVTGSRDHVDPHRSYALVISPFAKRGYVGTWHLSPASVLKTEEAVLGLPALSLSDALATDMSDIFGSAADATPYTPAPERVGASLGE